MTTTAHRRNSLGFDFVPDDDDWLLESGRRYSAASEDTDSAFVDDDLESSWDQLRLRQFKEQLPEAENQDEVTSRQHHLLQKLKRFSSIFLIGSSTMLDRHEKLMLIMVIFLIADTVLLSYLFATYPIYADILRRLGYNGTNSLFQRQAAAAASSAAAGRDL